MTGIEQLPQFEEGIAAALAGTTASVLCQYDRDRFDPVTLASAAACHTRSVATATYHAETVLRICRQYAPPGIRIAGEIDYKAEEPLALALAEAVRLDADITVNMAPLAFIDAPRARMIADTTRMLAESRTVTPQCLPQVAAGSVRPGLADLPGARLVTFSERCRRAEPSAGTTVLEQAFDGDSLYALRPAVAAHAAEAGLPRQRVYDVVTAAHELAANAVRHGAGHGQLRLWADGQALHCQVSDDGPDTPGPDGLWIIDQVADHVALDRGPAGTFTISRPG